MLHFKLNNLDQSVEAFDGAAKKLMGHDKTTVELVGFLDYQLSRIT